MKFQITSFYRGKKLWLQVVISSRYIPYAYMNRNPKNFVDRIILGSFEKKMKTRKQENYVEEEWKGKKRFPSTLLWSLAGSER